MSTRSRARYNGTSPSRVPLLSDTPSPSNTPSRDTHVTPSPSSSTPFTPSPPKAPPLARISELFDDDFRITPLIPVGKNPSRAPPISDHHHDPQGGEDGDPDPDLDPWVRRVSHPDHNSNLPPGGRNHTLPNNHVSDVTPTKRHNNVIPTKRHNDDTLPEYHNDVIPNQRHNNATTAARSGDASRSSGDAGCSPVFPLAAAYFGAAALFLAGMNISGLTLLTFPWVGSLLQDSLQHPSLPAGVILLQVMWCVHYIRRFTEVLYLHIYTRRMPFFTSVGAVLYYWVFGLWVGWSVNFRLGYVYRVPQLYLFIPGVLLFVTGEVGNCYTHWVLRQLRTKTCKGLSTNYKTGSKHNLPTAPQSKHSLPTAPQSKHNLPTAPQSKHNLPTEPQSKHNLPTAPQSKHNNSSRPASGHNNPSDPHSSSFKNNPSEPTSLPHNSHPSNSPAPSPTPSTPSARFIPTHPLFTHVTYPHYLFELLSWGGFFLAAHTLASALFLLTSALTLTFRAVQGHRRLRREYNGQQGAPLYPPRRKAIIPFVL